MKMDRSRATTIERNAVLELARSKRDDGVSARMGR
jgi:hypothetical protein